MDIQSLSVFLVKATVLLAAGMVVTAALRRASAGARHLVWVATLAGVLVLPAWLRFAPARLEVLPVLPEVPAVAAAAPAARPAPVLDFGRMAEAPVAPVVPAVDSAGFTLPQPTMSQALLGAWLAGLVLLLGRLAAAALSVRRIVRTARSLDADPAWSSLLCEAADRLGLPELPGLVSSDRVEMPFATGVWRGTIVLPAGASEWTEERRRLVLFHELAHMRRRDLLGHTLGRLACAAYWFHPMVWAAARRLRAESERACDDLVLSCGTRPSEYADHLLDILAAARRPGTPLAAVPMARRKEFEGRVLAILDPRLRRGALGRVPSAVLVSGLAAVFGVVAVLAPSPRASAATEPAGEAEIEVAVVASAAQAAEPRPQPAPAERPARRPVAKDAPDPAERDDDHDHGSDHDSDHDTGQDEEKPLDPARRATLVRVLRTDTDASVRRSAAWALSSSGEADVSEALAGVLRSDADAEVREMAAWALAHSRRPAAVPVLAEALKGDRSAEVRRSAAWALAHKRQADTSAFLAALKDSSSEVREVAIWALGNRRLDAAPAELTAALRDGDAQVRLVAAWALGEIRDTATLPALRAAFGDEKEDEVRRALFRALVMLGDHSTELIERALSDKDPELRVRAVQMLGGGRAHGWPWPWPRPEPRPMP